MRAERISDEPCGVCGSYVCDGEHGVPQHTPGPWKHWKGNTYFTKTGQTLTGEVVADSVGEVWVAVAWRDRLDHRTADANASLIAAAPELLSALRTLVDEPAWHRTLAPRERDALAAARAAIAKAEGKG